MSDFADRAKAKREQAAQGRRWSRSMSLRIDRERLLAIAVELEREAAELERQAAQPVTHIQQGGYSTMPMEQRVQQAQQQQEHQPSPTPNDGSGEPKT